MISFVPFKFHEDKCIHANTTHQSEGQLPYFHWMRIGCSCLLHIQRIVLDCQDNKSSDSQLDELQFEHP